MRNKKRNKSDVIEGGEVQMRGKDRKEEPYREALLVPMDPCQPECFLSFQLLYQFPISKNKQHNKTDAYYQSIISKK